MNRKFCWFVLACSLALAGCMVGPNYHRPAVVTPPTWRFAEKETSETINAIWWEQFQDPVLNELIRTALRENKDVKIAAARVEEFAGRYETTRAALFPQLGANGNASRTSSPTPPAPRSKSTPGTSPTPSTPTKNPANSYQVYGIASWQIDLWGKLRRATEAARADLLSTQEARRGVILTLVTAVASAYVNLRDVDRQLEIAKNTAGRWEDTYNLFQLQYKGGVISELELYQAKSQYEQALSTIPFFERAVAEQENNLSFLLGQNPGALARGKKLDEIAVPGIPAGLPSQLLENRPDIRQAEENLISANAQIGVARALYFPSISLTGLYGWVSPDLEISNQAARTWSYASLVTAPIFTGGAIRGQVKSAIAVQQEALQRYLQTIQGAFRDVENALVGQRMTKAQEAALARQVDALRQTAYYARLRYDNGYTSYLEVLDAERSLFAAELLLAQTRGTLLQAAVNVYLAMGGGWITRADEMTSGNIDPAGPADKQRSEDPPRRQDAGTLDAGKKNAGQRREVSSGTDPRCRE